MTSKNVTQSYKLKQKPFHAFPMTDEVWKEIDELETDKRDRLPKLTPDMKKMELKPEDYESNRLRNYYILLNEFDRIYDLSPALYNAIIEPGSSQITDQEVKYKSIYFNLGNTVVYDGIYYEILKLYRETETIVIVPENEYSNRNLLAEFKNEVFIHLPEFELYIGSDLDTIFLIKKNI